MTKTYRTFLIAGLSGIFVCAASVYAAQAPVVDITSSGARVRGGPTMEERITKLESVLENRTLEEFAARIDTLQQEIQRLQGHAETVNHNIEELKRKQRELYLDIDHRLRALETAQRSSSGSGEAAPNAAAGGNDRAHYDTAFAMLRDGKYEQAIVELQEFLKKYPGSEHAANAQYWVGYSYYALKDYKTALAQQRKLIAMYPASPKIPDALLNIASNQIELKDRAGAKKTLTEITTKHADSNAASLATKRLATLK